MSGPLFRRIALIGLGLIGSSLARVVKREGLASHIAGTARSQATRD
jgi:cyclohexadieny/prephenate dehydrogenase